MGSEQNRFPEERRKRWAAFFFCCFGGHKSGAGKRIVPSTRLPSDAQGAAAAAQPQPPQASLLAPPSSPASFTNSAVASAAPSPACFPSPGGPSSRQFATGPYAHETQLVSPPVLSTFTTEPSTAPLTPPPEMAQVTTPSSPDVPFARFLTSSGNFFCPETFAQFYLENPSQAGGRLSVSKESDVYSAQPPARVPKQQDPDEIEAYRASFGFSADEILTTAHFLEISPSDNISFDDEEDVFANMASSSTRNFQLSTSDAEVDYRRAK